MYPNFRHGNLVDFLGIVRSNIRKKYHQFCRKIGIFCTKRPVEKKINLTTDISFIIPKLNVISYFCSLVGKLIFPLSYQQSLEELKFTFETLYNVNHISTSKVSFHRLQSFFFAKKEKKTMFKGKESRSSCVCIWRRRLLFDLSIQTGGRASSPICPAARIDSYIYRL